MHKACPLTQLASILVLLFVTVNSGWERTGYSAPWQESLDYQPQELFPLRVGRYGYPYISALIDGNKVDVAIDTAHMKPGLSIASDLVERLGLPQVGFSTDVDSHGTPIGTDRVYRANEIKAFGQTWRGERIYELRRIDLDGLIGPRFLLGNRFTLDYGNCLIAVSKSPLPSPPSGSQVLPLMVTKRYEGMIVVQGSVNEFEVLIQVDTGKSRTCVDPELVANLRLPKNGDGYRVDEVRLGTFSFTVPSAKEVSFKRISEGLPKPMMLGIGSDIVSQVVLSVDYPRQLVMIGK